MAADIHLGSVSDFPAGEGVRVDVDSLPVPLAVFNTDEGFFALVNSCPHKGAPLSRAGTTPKTDAAGGTRGKLDVEKRTVTCPWHGLEFDLETGDCPATSYRVPAFEVVVDDDQVYLRR